MRILPDNPSVDFLRQEAKDLLAAMRETDPAAALSAAQRELADQYGFRSWTALRQEVDRRRSSPPVPPPGLGQALAEAFALGSLTEPPQGIAFEPMGRTWRLQTAEGRWIAQPQYHWMNDAQAELGERLRQAAAEVGVVSPAPRRTAGGGLVARLDAEGFAGPWRVDEWMDVGPVTTRPVPAATARAIGGLLARLHGLAIPSDLPFHAYTTTRRPMSTWDELIERGSRAAKPWVAPLVELLPQIEELIAVPDPSLDNPILGNCLINEDTVREGRGGGLVVVQWGFSGSVTPALEFASVLVHLVFRPSINTVAAHAFADGYREVAGSVPELDRSSFLFEIGGWCNWTWNQMCFSIDPADADQASFAENEALDAIAHPMTVDVLDRLIDAVAGPGQASRRNTSLAGPASRASAASSHATTASVTEPGSSDPATTKSSA